MKYRHSDVNGMGNTRYWFAVNPEELEILRGLLVTALRHMPETLETQPISHRMRDLSKGLAKALNQSQKEASESK